MQIISFAWTSDVLLDGRKTVTRRAWKEKYALRFKNGDTVQAYDQSPRAGGKLVAFLRLTHAPVFEPIALMPVTDFESEGFSYYQEQRLWMPERSPWKRTIPWFAFINWKRSGRSYWVIRFKVLKFV